MKVLVACECSGVVRDAFRARGHDAWSCDILDCDADPTYHIKGDVLQVLDRNWDLIIAHPPCTYLTISGNKWFKPEFAAMYPDRPRQRQEGFEFFMKMYNAPCDMVAVENPVGVVSTMFRPPDQYVQPYFFGDPYPKKTGLWLRGLPKLKPTNMVEPQTVTYNGKKYSPLHTTPFIVERKYSVIQDGPPGTKRADRAKARSKTFQGLANAMADQWGSGVGTTREYRLF